MSSRGDENAIFVVGCEQAAEAHRLEPQQRQRLVPLVAHGGNALRVEVDDG